LRLTAEVEFRLDFLGGELNKYTSSGVGDERFMFFSQASAHGKERLLSVSMKMR